MMFFNVNNYVLVRLTEQGRKILAASPDDWAFFTENGAGWYRVQLWCLMRVFGEHMAHGVMFPFGAEIKLPNENLRPEEKQ